MKKYLNRFFSLRTAIELMPFFAGDEKGSAKEITEAFAVFNLFEHKFRAYVNDENVNIVIVGDGVRPRCGALFAYLSKCQVFSIDPLMNPNFEPLRTTRRLHVTRGTAAETKIFCANMPTVLILPHSHAPMDEALGCLNDYGRLDIINMPCCVPILPRWAAKGCYYVKDLECWSPKNDLYLWTNVQEYANSMLELAKNNPQKGRK